SSAARKFSGCITTPFHRSGLITLRLSKNLLKPGAVCICSNPASRGIFDLPRRSARQVSKQLLTQIREASSSSSKHQSARGRGRERGRGRFQVSKRRRRTCLESNLKIRFDPYLHSPGFLATWGQWRSRYPARTRENCARNGFAHT